MPGNTRITMIGVKTETTQNTPVALAATDFMPAGDVDFTPNVEPVVQDYNRASIGELPHIAGRQFGELAFRTPNKWSGVAGTPNAPLAALIQAAGFTQTLATGSESVGAAFASANNLGTSPAPVLAVASAGFKTISGKFILTLLSKTTSNPEGAVFQIEWRPNNGGASEFTTFTVSDTAFADVAADDAGDIQDHIELTVNDPDGGGAGDPVTSWHVGDSWEFTYVSASQVGVIYTPANTKASSNYTGPGKSVSSEVWVESATGGQYYKCKGGLVANATLNAVAGRLSEWNFTLRSLFNGAAGDDTLPTEDHGEVLPAMFQNATLTSDGDSLCVENLRFTIENNVSSRVCASAEAGLAGFQITGRQVRLEFDPELPGVATHPVIANLRAGSVVAFVASWTIESNGSTPQKMTIAGNIQYVSAKPTGDREGIRTAEIQAKFVNDSETITFEEA